MTKEKVFKLMDEIESARFTYEFMFRPKPGVQLNQKTSLFENDLQSSMQGLSL